MKAMLMLIAVTALAQLPVPVPTPASTTIAVISDLHDECIYRGQCDSGTPPPVSAMVRSWKPDYIIAGGDIANYGSRAESYKQIFVNSLTSVTPGSSSIAIDPATLNGTLAVFGYPSDVLIPLPYVLSGALAVDEDNPAQFEIVQATAVPDSTHLTATFTKNHTAPFKLRASAYAMYADYVAAGKWVPAIGGHDYRAGASDWCHPVNGCDVNLGWAGFAEAYALKKPYYVRTLNPLVTVIVVDNNDMTGYTGALGYSVGQSQELALRSALASCPSRWCIAVEHQPTYTICGTVGGQNGSTPWVAGAGVDLVVNGHIHAYEHIEGPDYAASGRRVQYVGAGGYSGIDRTDNAGWCNFSCGSNCTSKAFISDLRIALKATITSTSLHLEAIDETGAVREQFTLNK